MLEYASFAPDVITVLLFSVRILHATPSLILLFAVIVVIVTDRNNHLFVDQPLQWPASECSF